MSDLFDLPSTRLTPKGLAFSKFAFLAGPAVCGLSEKEAYETAKRLIERWDGSESLLQIYNRTEHWPNEISGD